MESSGPKKSKRGEVKLREYINDGKFSINLPVEDVRLMGWKNGDVIKIDINPTDNSIILTNKTRRCALVWNVRERIKLKYPKEWKRQVFNEARKDETAWKWQREHQLLSKKKKLS